MSEDSRRPNDETIAWVEAAVGPVEVLSPYAHEHGYSKLWRLRAGADYLWLKLHQYPGKWAGEVHALLHWAPALDKSPLVLAYRNDPPAVLLTEVPGTMASKMALSEAAESRLWREAGEYLARLHQIRNDRFGEVGAETASPKGTLNDAETFVRNGIESRISQGSELGLWSASEETFLRWASKSYTEALRGEGPVAVHRDSGPRNWLTDESGQLLSVIDWEHARWDVWSADLNRPWDDAFVQKPHLAAALIEGYGGFDERRWAQVQASRLLNAVGGIVWSLKVGDEAYFALNRAGLARMMEEASCR